MKIPAIFKGERLRRFFETRRMTQILVIIFVGSMALIPLFFILWNSFKDLPMYGVSDYSFSNWTLENFIEAYGDPKALKMLLHSFLFAIGSMAVALGFGGALAFLVERTNTPLRNILYGLMFIPLALPSMLKAIAWVLLLSPTNGLLNQLWFALGFSQPLFTAFSLPAMCWVEGISMSSLTFLLLGASLRAMDPSLEEAAFTSGANKPTTLFRITFRLMAPALAGIAVLQFVRGLEAFDVPLIMGFSAGIRVFSTNIYYAVKELTPPLYAKGYTYSMILIAMSVIGVILYNRVLARSERYATVTGKGYRPRIMDLGKWRPVAGGFVIFFVFVALVMPLLILLWASLIPYYMVPSMAGLGMVSLDNYQHLLNDPQFTTSVKNTLMVCIVVSIGGMLMATLVSWMVIRQRTRASRVLDYLSFIPYAIPSIAVGFGIMVFFLAFPNPIYNTIWIIMLAYLVKFLPIGTRFTHAGVAQIRSELEEAAAASGAGLFATLRRVTVPLLLPSLIGGGLFIFLLSAKVLSIAAILYTHDTFILPVLILRYWEIGGIPVTAALSVVMILGLITITIVSRTLVQRRALVAEV
ncbi:ABC transporter permease [Chloroflexota bacterium]